MRDYSEREEKKDLENWKRYQESLLDESEIDWTDANVEGVTLDGMPLDGKYFDSLIEDIEIKR